MLRKGRWVLNVYHPSPYTFHVLDTEPTQEDEQDATEEKYDDEEEIDWQLPQQPFEEDEMNLGGCSYYGFANKRTGVFARLQVGVRFLFTEWVHQGGKKVGIGLFFDHFLMLYTSGWTLQLLHLTVATAIPLCYMRPTCT